MNYSSLFNKTWFRIGFFALMAIVMLIHNDSVSLWDQDEAAYAGFAKRMVETGDYLIPDYPWSDIHRKPPMHFWDISMCYKVFGINEFSVRFPSALFVFLTLLLVFRGTRKFLSKDEAFLSAFVLGTSLFVLSLAKISVTDGTLLFFIAVAAVQMINQVIKPSWKNVLFFWLAFAAGLLLKGPPIIIFTGFFAVILLAFHPQRMRLLRFHPWFFLPVAASPLFYWGYLAWQVDGGEFIIWMVDWYILKRIGGSVLGQTAPFGSHFLFILVSFLPYVFAIPLLAKRGFGALKNRELPWIVLILWFVAGWFPFELSPSKLPAYTVVAHIPLSMLIAKVILSGEGAVTVKRGWVIAQAVFAVLFILGVPLAGAILGLGSWFMISSVLLACLFVVLLFRGLIGLWRNGDSTPMLFYNMAFVSLLWIVIYPQVDVFKNSPRRVAQALEPSTTEVVIVANSKGHPPSLVFYLDCIFDEVIFEENADILREKVREKNLAMVLNQEQYESLKSTATEVEAKQICSNFTDRKGKMCYYVIQP